ncbi:MAG: stage V sporulation protein AD [Clostridia bacterium]|nr:stage V sporulation protein AD [Clostridia bacterium]
MPQSIIHPDASILAAATVVGSKEHSGPLGAHFDYYGDDDRFGQNTWEKAESEMQRMAMAAALDKVCLRPNQVDMLFAGDLLNQCVGSSYGLLSYDIPYFGLYGACSTSVEGLLLASAMIGGGHAKVAVAVTSSHNAAAERQFRSPLEYGGQRPPTGQWTVTGAGAFVVASPHELPDRKALAHVTHALPGIVVDLGITDANNMGAAMAPAAVSTLLRYFDQSGTRPEDYDLIVTGDLGWEGSRILCDIMKAERCDISDRHNDCGKMIFSRNTQDTHSGGSGCGCAAVVLGSYLLPMLQRRDLRRILFMATGAMMSPDSVKQGQSIPGVAHLLCLECP